MSARPILFSAPMVRALRNGSKTQTRRVAKPRGYPSLLDGSWSDSYVLDPGNRDWLMRDCPYGQPGDLLWVRETIVLREGKRGDRIIVDQPQFAADGAPVMDRNGYASNHPFSPAKRKAVRSIHMPRWASRLTLRITDVRLQRLRDISEDDARDEGVDEPGAEPAATAALMSAFGGALRFQPYASAYARLWEQINGSGSWDANPWVWALTFDVIPRNVDDVLLELANAEVKP